MGRLFDLNNTPIDDGVTVVEASAGTGKTYCLTGLVLRLLLERRVSDVSELLVVTFTNAATQELVERLRDALSATCRLLAGEGTSDDPFLRHLAETYRGDGEASCGIVGQYECVEATGFTSSSRGICRSTPVCPWRVDCSPSQPAWPSPPRWPPASRPAGVARAPVARTTRPRARRA